MAAGLLVAMLSVDVPAQDAKAVVDDVARAMGAANLTGIVMSGTAAVGNFGQSRTISFGLASTAIRNYSRALDLSQPALRDTGEALPPTPPGAAAPRPSPYEQVVLPADTEWAKQMQIWLTPWGFLKGAATHPATLRSRKVDEVTYKVITWSPAQKAPSGQTYRVVGYINPQQLVERVETWVEHPIFGDMHVEMRYSGYQSVSGLAVPTRVAERRVGMETFVVAISQVRANPPDLAQLTAPSSSASSRANAAPPEPQPVASERLADGVYRITGGYVALAVEFRDHAVVLEAGQNEARGLAILAETRRLFPGKRIKYVVNTHPHFDHAAGLPPFGAEGITILTDDANRYFLEQALGGPRTLVGDVLGKSKKKPKVEGVVEKMVLQDETRTLELHHLEKLEHSDGMLVAYLPKERILFTADFNAPGPGQASPSIATLVANLDRLGIDFDRHVLVHPQADRPMTKADLVALAKGAN